MGIPYNFLKDKKNLSESELFARMSMHHASHLFAIDKSLYADVSMEDKAKGDLPQLPPLQDGLTVREDFSNRHNNLRLMLQDLVLPRIIATGTQRFNEGNTKMVNDKPVKIFPQCSTVEDFIMLYRGSDYFAEARNGNIEPRKKMLRMVYFTGKLMWGKPVIRSIEKTVMDKGHIVYNGRLVDGTELKQRRNGGTVGLMIDRMVQTKYSDPLR